MLRRLAPIGRVSFSMYIFHFIVLDGLVMVFQKFYPALLLRGNLFFVVLYLITVPITFALASISYRLVEKPGMTLGKNLTNKFLLRFGKMPETV